VLPAYDKHGGPPGYIDSLPVLHSTTSVRSAGQQEQDGIVETAPDYGTERDGIVEPAPDYGASLQRGGIQS